MNCPTCKEILLTIEYNQIEVDYCPECLGVWLDEGELDLLFGEHELAHGFMTAGNPAVARGERPRPCPICGTSMGKAVTGGTAPIVYDGCPKEHGLWFDRGELLGVFEQGAQNAGESPVSDWLRNIFSPSTPPTSNP